MKDLGYVLGKASLASLRCAFRILVTVGYLLTVLARRLTKPLARMLSRGRGDFTPGARRSAAAGPSLGRIVPLRAMEADPNGTAASTEPFKVASRIVSIRLLPPVGVINLRVYEAEQLVRRDLVINEPRLRSMMRGRRHAFPDAVYEAVKGLEQIKTETLALAEALINRLGNEAARSAKPRSQRTTPAVPSPSPVSAPVPPVLALPEPQGISAAQEQPAAHQVVGPPIRTGLTYVGKLVKAGSTTVTPWGRPPFDIFEATLALQNGAEMALRGAELERELNAQGCVVGQQVAITPMGKVPVTLGNGAEGQKNLYRVRRMEAQGGERMITITAHGRLGHHPELKLGPKTGFCEFRALKQPLRQRRGAHRGGHLFLLWQRGGTVLRNDRAGTADQRHRVAGNGALDRTRRQQSVVCEVPAHMVASRTPASGCPAQGRGFASSRKLRGRPL